jgi:predicted secreted protein
MSGIYAKSKKERTMPIRSFPQRICLMIATCLAAPALAGDASRAEIIGFSDDGSVFSFEEFGREDGSGFAYVNRHVVSKNGDVNRVAKFVDRTGTLSISEARKKFAEQFNGWPPESFGDNPGITLVSDPITELSADRQVVSFAPVFSET